MITSEPPRVKAHALYTCTEASKLLGICRTPFLKYCAANLITPTIDTTFGRKYYEGQELTRFWKRRFTFS